jgi:acyl-CoA synthetase
VNVDVFPADLVAAYTQDGFWDDESIATRIARHAASRPDAIALHGDDDLTVTWRQYHELSAGLGATLAGVGLERGDPVGILLPDGPTAHVAYVAAEKAGLVAIGIGPRAGSREIAHLLHETGTTTLLTFERHRGHDTAQLVAELRTMGASITDHLTIDHQGDSFSMRLGGVDLDVAPFDDATAMLAAGRSARTSCSSSTRRRGRPACRSA